MVAYHFPLMAIQMNIQVSANGNTGVPIVAVQCTVQLFLQHLWLCSVQVCLLVVLLYHSFHLWLYRCSYKYSYTNVSTCGYTTIPSTCSYTGAPTSGYTSVSTCGYTVPFLPLVAIQVLLQVDTSVSTCGSAPQLERVGGASLLSPTSGDIDNPSPPSPSPLPHRSTTPLLGTNRQPFICTSCELGEKIMNQGFLISPSNSQLFITSL
jgi:hypothetical protein